MGVRELLFTAIRFLSFLWFLLALVSAVAYMFTNGLLAIRHSRAMARARRRCALILSVSAAIAYVCERLLR